MRIVYVAPIRIPTERAHGYAVMKLCESFAVLGHTVTLITPDKKAAGIAVSDPFEYYGVKRIFTLATVAATDLLGHSDTPWKYASLFDLLTFVSLVWLQHAPLLLAADAIYIRNYQLAFLLPRKKLCLELHDMPQRKSNSFKNILAKVSSVVTISIGLRTAVQEIVPTRSVTVAPDAVDLERFSALPAKEHARETLGLPHTPTVLYAGHFYPWKGVGTFVASAKELNDCTCVAVGGVAPEYDEMKDQAAGIKNCILVPFVAPDQIPLYLAAADVLVLPNSAKEEIGRSYTSPLKLFEYMASGKPIVASDLPSLREILDETTACLVTPDDHRSLAAGIQKLLDAPDLAARLAQNAQQKVQQYTWRARAQAILTALT